MPADITNAVTPIVTMSRTHAVTDIPVMAVKASTHGEIKSNTPRIPCDDSIDCRRGADGLIRAAKIVSTPSMINVVVVFASLRVQIAAKTAYKRAAAATPFRHAVRRFIELNLLKYRSLTLAGALLIDQLVKSPDPSN
ncbi:MULTISPECIES: hypothetical protein [Arthrobacter]|uniref:hypothetical protein n=1 Tax=Arthrobacter TaxID=1663 RepID=UPI0033945CFE